MLEAEGLRQLEHYKTKSIVCPSSYLVTRSSHESESSECPVLQKMTFRIPHVLYYKYSYIHEMCKVAIKRKTLREVSTTTHLIRERATHF